MVVYMKEFTEVSKCLELLSISLKNSILLLGNEYAEHEEIKTIHKPSPYSVVLSIKPNFPKTLFFAQNDYLHSSTVSE